MTETIKTNEMKSHCNTCGGDRTHKVLISEGSTWEDEEDRISGGANYHMLKRSAPTCCNGN